MSTFWWLPGLCRDMFRELNWINSFRSGVECRQKRPPFMSDCGGARKT